MVNIHICDKCNKEIYYHKILGVWVKKDLSTRLDHRCYLEEQDEDFLDYEPIR